MKKIINLKNTPIPFTLKRHPTARRVSLCVSERNGLVVVSPRYIEIGHLRLILEEKADWILESLRTNSTNRREELAGVPLKSGATISFCGTSVVLDIRTGAPAVSLEGETLTIHVPVEEGAILRRLLMQWFRAQARVIIPERVATINARFHLHHGRITVRDQTTRWGSCSRNRTLSFNWRLVLLPTEVMDYLIIHELAHLGEMNHSEQYWKLVERMCPRYGDAERWLRRNGGRYFS
ncbi:MAG: M48 family metallopeptidase [Bacteroidota bacterium]